MPSPTYPSAEPACHHCHKPESTLARPLSRCAKCHTTQYCSRTCQRADWKAHKKICNGNDNGGKDKGKSKSIAPTATKEKDGKNTGNPRPPKKKEEEYDDEEDADDIPYHTHPSPSLHALADDTTARTTTLPAVLLHAYLVRLSDERRLAVHHHRAKHAPPPPPPPPPDTILSAMGSPLRDYQRFLDRAEVASASATTITSGDGNGGLLPRWWSPRVRALCEDVARYGSGKGDGGGGGVVVVVRSLFESGDAVVRRGAGIEDGEALAELRGLGVAIYGTDVVRDCDGGGEA